MAAPHITASVEKISARRWVAYITTEYIGENTTTMEVGTYPTQGEAIRRAQSAIREAKEAARAS